MNKERLRQLADYIENHPENYKQEIWSSIETELRPSRTKLAEIPDEPTCGTAACLAGHACVLAGYTPLASGYVVDPQMKNFVGRVNEVAEEWLDLDFDAVFWLFSELPEIDWPGKYGTEYEEATTLKAKAKVAAQLLRDLADGKV